MESTVREAIEAIHRSGYRCVIHCVGGHQALAWLLGVPGASRTVLEARVPYGKRSFREILSPRTPWNGSHCSESAARLLARSAYERAVRLSECGDPVVGIGATSVLQSERERKGGRRAYVAAELSRGVIFYELKFGGYSKRWSEDALVGKLIVQSLQDCTVKNIFSSRSENALELIRDELHSSDTVERPVIHERADVLDSVISGDIEVVEYYKDHFEVGASRSNVFLSGSFDPLHDGHRDLLKAAAAIRGDESRPCYELSAINVDKPPLERKELVRRLKQFGDTFIPLAVTGVPLFSAKAELFPNSSFVIGYDTAVRLFMPKYYNGREEEMHNSFATMLRKNCDFLVAGREVKHASGEKTYMTLADIDVPPQYRSILKEIPESAFRRDISSTELRAKEAQIPHR